MAAVTNLSDFRAQEEEICHCFHLFPSICHEVMGLDAMILVSLILSFKPTLSLSSFTLIKRLFSSSSFLPLEWYHPYIWSCWYFFLAILIPAYNSSSPAFPMMLNKQGDNKQPCYTPFSIRNQSLVPYKVITVASWPAYRFLRRQVRWLVFPNI